MYVYVYIYVLCTIENDCPAAGLALPQEVTAWPVTALYSAIQASASGPPALEAPILLILYRPTGRRSFRVRVLWTDPGPAVQHPLNTHFGLASGAEARQGSN